MKHNYQITEIEQQILKTINHIKYVYKEGVNRKIMKKKKSTTTFDDKHFAEDPLEIHPKTCNDKSHIPEESVDTASKNSKNESPINDIYGDILSDKSFTNQHINHDYPNKTTTDNKININRVEHWSDSITSPENLNVKSEFTFM